MNISAIQSTQQTPKRNNAKLVLNTALGATIGAGARYILPTKQELNSFFNKEAVDTFVSSTSTAARGSARSILKYAGIGAVVACGLSLVKNAIKTLKQPINEEIEYSKLGAIIDAPDYACEIMWYGE